MTDLYGADWTGTLAEQEVESARASGDDPAQTTRTRLSPSGVAGIPPEAGQLEEAPVAPGTPRPVAAPVTEESPGSGITGTGAPRSPGSGRRSPESWSSQNPGTPTRLKEVIIRVYDPRKEELGAFLTRIRKQAAALAALGEPVDPEVLRTYGVRGQYESMVYEQAPDDVPRQIRLL